MNEKYFRKSPKSKFKVKLKLIKLYIFTCIYILNTSGQLIVCLFQIFSVFLIQPPIKLFNLKMRCFGSDAAFDLQSN